MAKQKAASRTAAQTAVKKKWAGHKSAAKSSSRKTIKSKVTSTSKARGVPAVKKTVKSKTPKSKTPKLTARPKQRIAISHHREEDFKADRKSVV